MGLLVKLAVKVWQLSVFSPRGEIIGSQSLIPVESSTKYQKVIKWNYLYQLRMCDISS